VRKFVTFVRPGDRVLVWNGPVATEIPTFGTPAQREKTRGRKTQPKIKIPPLPHPKPSTDPEKQEAHPPPPVGPGFMVAPVSDDRGPLWSDLAHGHKVPCEFIKVDFNELFDTFGTVHLGADLQRKIAQAETLTALDLHVTLERYNAGLNVAELRRCFDSADNLCGVQLTIAQLKT
jgi:hypothetical protein